MPKVATKNAAIYFEPEAYVLDGPKLMGRQSAGNAFLRAAVYGRAGETLMGYGPRKAAADVLAKVVSGIDPDAKTGWIMPTRFEHMAAHGTLFVPGPTLADAARLRLRAGSATYSLTGVTHTTASHGAMDALSALVSAPLMPWDALICTSQAVHATTRRVIEAETEYLSWRLQTPLRGPLPELPIIPLGVHCRDFEFSDRERREARAALGCQEGEAVALFVGRLSFHAKAHPHAMYVGLNEAAKRSGNKVALIQCGWFANEAIASAFKQGAATYAPRVRSLFTDGRNEAARRQSWAAADVFVTLSDNVQETFGLAPIEAMAAGLPVVASDWDGYRDTVRDGVEGFLIATAMPAPGHGAAFAQAHESDELNYDKYIGALCRMISVDLEALAGRLTELVASVELRQRLGHAGRQRARKDFDWAHIFQRYQDLWSRLAELRGDAQRDGLMAQWIAAAPRVAPARLDPFTAFAEYPTLAIASDTELSLVPGRGLAAYKDLTGAFLFGYEPETLPRAELVGALIEGMETGASTPRQIAQRLSAEEGSIILAAAILVKMGVMRIGAHHSARPS